jgi:UDP-N-acetylmuramoylalanine--D-glutamate ligase
MSEDFSVSLPSRRYLVLGLGLTGQAVARWLAAQGCELVLVDTREAPAVEALKAELSDASVRWHLGEALSRDWIADVDVVVISPGLSPHEAQTGAFVQAAQAANKAVVGDVELFAQALESLQASHNYQPTVLAVTGTNGKTTVTALTRHMAHACGWRAVAAGNIAPPVLQALADMVIKPREQWPEVWVLELSSFQLHYTQSLKPRAAVVLNISQDHLDWHASFDEYVADKARIFTQAELCLVNRDDSAVQGMVGAIDQKTVRTFGCGVPVYSHDVGLQTTGGMQWLVSVEPDVFEDQIKPARRRKSDPPEPRTTGRVARLMPVDALPMPGIHNTLNVLAAALLVRAAGGGWAPILKAAGSYHGEPHRMQFVRTVRDVDFYNDSKGTNVGATTAAVTGLDRRLILIAGGLAKDQSFEPLGQALVHKARAVVLIGQDAPALQSVFEAKGLACHLVPDMARAVAQALALAQPGDAVLLSPACASFDMFASYTARGEAFVNEVADLAMSFGEVA